MFMKVLDPVIGQTTLVQAREDANRDIMIAMTCIFMSNISSFTTPYLIGENFPQMLGVFLRKQFSNRYYERAAAISVLIFLFSSVSAVVYIYTNLKDKDWERL
jgi:putative spermidine/putrescine transport system permease protein